ncbi:MAG TPA: archaellin/type IV pilin N-terminal domain-containing protein [Dehalococcoidales bacterium]|nr:archaellin/type IV pilin N-terminal domain-containing protein [Dehalococcoidales bacterium]
MLKTAFTRLKVTQKGITGIETAIILIAFVVVASVFAYVALSSGLFASQKSQEAIYKGVQDAQGSVVLKGGVVSIAENPGANGFISQITFTLGCAMRGNPIDFTPPDPSPLNNGLCAPGSQNRVVISYYDGRQKFDNLYWTVTPIGYSSDDNLLDSGELFQIKIGSPVVGTNGGNLANLLAANPLGANTTFNIQVTTASGSTLVLQRTTPGFIDPVINFK